MQTKSVLVKVLVLVSILALSTHFAWGQTVQVNPATSNVVAGGAAFDVAVQISGISNLQASHVEFTFDNTVVQFAGVTRGTVMPGDDVFQPAPTAGPGVTKVTVDQAVIGDTPWSGDGTLFTISFIPLKGGTSAVDLTVTLRDPMNQAIIPTGVTDGQVNVTNPVPTLTSINPNTKAAGDAEFVLTTTGTNFINGASKVYLDGTERTTTFVSATELSATILASDIVTPGTRSVTVVNAAPGGGPSGAQTLTVTSGTATKLAFGVQPVTTAAGAAITPAITVRIEDASGNLVTGDTRNVTLAIGTNPSSGTLSGTATVAAVNGLATFTTLSIDKAGTGYTLVASSTPALTGATSSAFDIMAGAATQLQLETAANGSGVVVGDQSLDAAGTLTVYAITRDAANNFVENVAATSWSLSDVTGGVVAGDLVPAGDNKSAVFTAHAAGSAKINAAAGVLTDLTGTITVSAGTATQVRVETAADGAGTVVPAQSLTSGSALTVYAISRDASNNFVANVAADAWALESITGGVVAGDLVPAGDNKSAVFTGHVAGSVAIKASEGAFTTTSSGTITVTSGGATKLAFGVQPVTTAAGAAITPAITVRIEDASGNLVTGDTRNVTLAIGTNPSSGTLSGTATVAAVAGVATFTTLSIDKAGTGYTLVASSTPALTGASSSAFDIMAGTATQLVFGVQPVTTAAGAAITPAITVRIEDASGNLVTGDTRNVTLAIGTNPSGGTLAGTTTVAAVAGLATFTTLSLDKAGTGYTLVASSTPALTGATSSAFDITSGAISQFAFNAVSAQVSGTPFSITVTALDANGNTVTSYAGLVTLTATAGTINPGFGTFTAGVLTLQVTVTGSGTGTMGADDGVGHTGTSNSFTLTAAPQLYLKASSLVSSSSILYPNTDWNVTGDEPNDWSWTASPEVVFYVVPEPGIVLSSYTVTLSWVGTELSYLSATTGNVAGLTYDPPAPGTDQLTLHAVASGGDITIAAGGYLAMVKFTILKPGHTVVQIPSASFSRSGIGSFAVAPNNGDVRAFLGDVAFAEAPAGESSGDGLIDFQDLSPWGLSYWSGVPGHPTDQYKVKYDIGPTTTGYVWGLPAHDVGGTLAPGPDGMIEFEDLVIFSISYGLSHTIGGLPKTSALQEEPVQVWLGQPAIAGSETRIPVVLGGTVTDVRAMSLELKGQFGRFLGAEHGSLLKSYSTPVSVMTRSDEKQVYIDLAVMGLDAQALNQPGELVVLRFEGTPKVQLVRHDARTSHNQALPVEKVRGAGESVPASFALLQNYPNPFNPSTTIEYELPSEAKAHVAIYNVLGEQVATLVNDVQPAGFYSVRWNGTDDNGAKVATGVYLYRMQTASFTTVKKMLLLK